MWLREKNSNYLGISPGLVSHGEVGKVIPRGRKAEQSEMQTKTMNECGRSETQGKFVCLLSTPHSAAPSRPGWPRQQGKPLMCQREVPMPRRCNGSHLQSQPFRALL